MYNELIYEVWEQDKINRKGKTTVTNFDKVKELITLDKINLDMSEIDICSIIHTVRKEQTCIDRSCNECYKWLKQEYKEPPKPILTDKEKEYLSAVIKPFRSEVEYIVNANDLEYIEKDNDWAAKQFIGIVLNDGQRTYLPYFDRYSRYKGMIPEKRYSLEELGL